ncbi:hypothetical protein BDAP_000908 [Binucleata daphniae]
MNTLKKVFDLRVSTLNIKEFLYCLVNDTKLFEDLVLTINWIKISLQYNSGHTLVHNIKDVYIEYMPDGTDQFLFILYDYKYHEHKKYNFEIMAKLQTVLINYYNRKKFGNNREIFENENIQKFHEYIHFYMLDYKEYDEEVEAAFNAIAFVRGYLTKIPYIAKSSYYKDAKRYLYLYISTQQWYFLYKKESEFYEFNDALLMFKNIKKNEFKVLHMHTQHNMVCICTLSKLLENEVNYLANFADVYVETMIKSIYEKHLDAITKFFVHLIPKNELLHVFKKIKKCVDAKENCITKIDVIIKYVKQILQKNAQFKILYHKDFEKQLDNAYESIFNEIESCAIRKNRSTFYIHNVKNKTLNMFKEYRLMQETCIKVKEIIKLHEDIKEKMKNIIDDNDHTFLEITDRINFSDCSKHMDVYDPTLQAHSPLSLTSLSHIAAASSNQVSAIISANKHTFTDIMTSTIQLKSMIIEAQNNAFELTNNLLTYINSK